MSYKYLFVGVGVGALVVGLIIFGLLTSANSESKELNTSIVPITKADKVEVFLFHATQRCTTCIAIGRLAGETVNEYFQSELKDGKIEFREVNIDLTENKTLAEKFQASGSSLFLNAISDGKDNIAEDVNVWRLTQNPTRFKNYLKGKIDNLLGK